MFPEPGQPNHPSSDLINPYSSIPAGEPADTVPSPSYRSILNRNTTNLKKKRKSRKDAGIGAALFVQFCTTSLTSM